MPACPTEAPCTIPSPPLSSSPHLLVTHLGQFLFCALRSSEQHFALKTKGNVSLLNTVSDTISMRCMSGLGLILAACSITDLRMQVARSIMPCSSGTPSLALGLPSLQQVPLACQAALVAPCRPPVPCFKNQMGDDGQSWFPSSCSAWL